MKTLATVVVLTLALAGCASTASRIEKNQAAFDAYPAEVQQKIRAGEVDVGFTPEQVRMALGDPDHRSQRQDSGGTSEVWGYRDSGPSFGIGIGGGSFGGSTGVGGGVGVSTGGDSDDKIRVVFRDNKVAAVEKRVSK